MKYLTLIALILLTAYPLIAQPGHYYWYNGEKHHLERIDNKQYVLLKQKKNRNSLGQELKISKEKIGRIKRIKSSNSITTKDHRKNISRQ